MRKTTGPALLSGGRTDRGRRLMWLEEVPSSRASLASGPKPYPDLHSLGSASQEEDMEGGRRMVGEEGTGKVWGLRE